jgi:small subunit ribosomal protein S9
MAEERQYFEGIGRRKTSSARVRLYPGGDGTMIINDKPAEEYLPRFGDVKKMFEPLSVVGQESAYTISVKVSGGGITGQSEAIQLGVARALLEVNPEFRTELRHADVLTRDPRAKERKKPGLKRARKAPTYTKR